MHLLNISTRWQWCSTGEPAHHSLADMMCGIFDVIVWYELSASSDVSSQNKYNFSRLKRNEWLLNAVLNLLFFPASVQMDYHSALSESSVSWAQAYDAVHIHWNTRSPLKMMLSARPRLCLLPVGLISKVVTTTICHTQGETMSVILQCSKLNVQKTYGFSVPDFIHSGWALMMEQELYPAFMCGTVETRCLPKRFNVSECQEQDVH